MSDGDSQGSASNSFENHAVRCEGFPDESRAMISQLPPIDYAGNKNYIRVKRRGTSE